MNPKPARKLTTKFPQVWLEEFKSCSCTNLVDKKSEAIGYCPVHGNDRLRITRLPRGEMKLGYAG